MVIEMSEDWVSDGIEDGTAQGPSVPMYIEAEPDVFKLLVECTAEELAAAGEARKMQAKALMEESQMLLKIAKERAESDPKG